MNEAKQLYAEAGRPMPPLIYPTFVSAVASLLQCQLENKVLETEVARLQHLSNGYRDELEKKNRIGAELADIKRDVAVLGRLMNGTSEDYAYSASYLVKELTNYREQMQTQYGLEKDAHLWYTEPARPVSSYLTAKAKAGGLNPHDAQLLQLMSGPVADKDLLSNSVRNDGIASGYMDRVDGFTFITGRGISYLAENDFIVINK